MADRTSEILQSIYQFDNFVTGPSNRLAFAAARKVAENPGNVYNPLVIHGGVGMGKTHLIHAVGNAAARRQPDWNIVFLNGSQMSLEDLIAAEKSDLLLFDDLHLGLQDRKVQIRLLPLFDRMVGSGRQIIATTDIPPHRMESLDQKLLSRLMGGLIVGLKEIEAGEKSLIVARKSRDRGVELGDEIALLIASRVPSNIRELEGALNKVLLYASLAEGPLTRAVVDEALPALQAPESAPEQTELAPAPEEPGPGPSGEFGDFLSGLDHKVSALIDEEQNADKLRQEYKEKLFIWRMKGFNTSGIEKILEQDISIVTQAYQEYTANIERLIALQQEFGPLSIKASPEQIARIESLMFDPDKADDLELAVRTLARNAGNAPEPPRAPERPATPPVQAAPPPQPIEEPEAPVPALTRVASLSPDRQPPSGPEGEEGHSRPGTIIETWPFLEDRLIEDID